MDYSLAANVNFW